MTAAQDKPDPACDLDPPSPSPPRPPAEAPLGGPAGRGRRRGAISLAGAAAGLVGLHALDVPWWGLVLAFLAAAVAYQPLGRHFAKADHLHWIRSRAQEWERERAGGPRGR